LPNRCRIVGTVVQRSFNGRSFAPRLSRRQAAGSSGSRNPGGFRQLEFNPVVLPAVAEKCLQQRLIFLPLFGRHPGDAGQLPIIIGKPASSPIMHYKVKVSAALQGAQVCRISQIVRHIKRHPWERSHLGFNPFQKIRATRPRRWYIQQSAWNVRFATHRARAIGGEGVVSDF
jgi:hypothetical protein